MIQIQNPARVLPLTSLQKFALGSAWSMVGRLMLLIAVASMAFSMLVGEYSALSSITKARDSWYSAGQLADLELRFTPAPNQSAPRFDELPGLTDSMSPPHPPPRPPAPPHKADRGRRPGADRNLFRFGMDRVPVEHFDAP